MVVTMVRADGSEQEVEDGSKIVMALLPGIQDGTDPATIRQRNKFVFVMWLVALGLLAAVMAFIAWMLQDNWADKDSRTVLMAVFTSLIGALVGLFVPSPVSK